MCLFYSDTSPEQQVFGIQGHPSEGQYLKCIIHTKLRAVRLQTWPRAFNFIVGFVFQIFVFQIFVSQIFGFRIFGFQICRFTFKYWVCPTCLSLANFHQAFPPNRIITKRTDCRELGSENENISVKKCRASGSGIFHNQKSRLLDNVLHALRALRPCDPRINAMMGQCIGDVLFFRFFLDFIFFLF